MKPVVVVLLALMIRCAFPAAAEAPGGLEQLEWLSGCWQGDEGEECWLPAKAKGMIGINRNSDGSRFELLRIVEDDEGRVTYLASPQGRCPATPFAAVEASDRRVVFANPEHDFPQTIVYWLDPDGVLHARVAATVEGVENGFEITWRRQEWPQR